MAKRKPDMDLYRSLRDSGLRKKTAKRVAEALPAKGQKRPTRAHRFAEELTQAAETIRERAGGGQRKRAKAAQKAARTRKAKVAKRRSSGRKGARSRATA
jgi:hypothetical protein